MDPQTYKNVLYDKGGIKKKWKGWDYSLNGIDITINSYHLGSANQVPISVVNAYVKILFITITAINVLISSLECTNTFSVQRSWAQRTSNSSKVTYQ